MATTQQCECADPGCECGGRCTRKAWQRVFRIDMEDYSGTVMCKRCVDDAMKSGVFSYRPCIG